MRRRNDLTRGRIGLSVPSLLLAVCLSAPPAYANEKLSDLRALFYDGQNYAEVLKRLSMYREQPYGKRAEVDYMIAACLCRTGSTAEAKERFKWIVSRYPLDPARRKAVEQAARQCGSANRTAPVPFVEPTVTARRSERQVGVSGKSGLDVGTNPISIVTGTQVAVTSETAELLRDIPPEEFEGRLFDLSQERAAVEGVRRLAGPGFRVARGGPFILASASYHSEEDLRRKARWLESYASFYARQYGMPLPAKFITVYLVARPEQMQQLASRLHGIRFSETGIGYSFPQDLSMVSVDDMGDGTLAHELFHLMVRNNFGDVPPWLDEGMASLYEVSAHTGDRIAGVSNWRGDILKRFWGDQPTVEQLVRMDWRAFDSADGLRDLSRQAVNHATARYFILYLQETGRLADVYRAFQRRRAEDVGGDPAADAVTLLASTLRVKSLAEVDNDFKRWFIRLRESELRNLGPAGNAPAGNAPTGNVPNPARVAHPSAGVSPSGVSRAPVNIAGAVDPASASPVNVNPANATPADPSQRPPDPAAANNAPATAKRAAPNAPATSNGAEQSLPPPPPPKPKKKP